MRFFIASAIALSLGLPGAAAAEKTFVVVVMDPLARPLSCDCVKGFAQRNYDRLGEHLESRLDHPVRVVYSQAISTALRSTGGKADLVIGKCSVVRADAKECKLQLRPLAMLAGKDGKTSLTGLLVVPSGDRARRIADLKGYRIIFGPADSDEKHAAAKAALRAAGVEVKEPVETRPGCSDAALAAIESTSKPGAAAVISSYAMALLEGCGTIQKGELRVIGETGPVPFIGAFAAESLGEKARGEVLQALLDVVKKPDLLKALETTEGFLAVEVEGRAKEESGPKKESAPQKEGGSRDSAEEWPGWRGSRRDGIVPWLPSKLPVNPGILWKRDLEGPGLSGIAAVAQGVIVAGRDALDGQDIFLCLRPGSGERIWELRYQARGKLDYGNSPRATPLVSEGRVYLLGAFGNLHCVSLADGSVIWRKHLILEFDSKLPKWGMTGSPLIADGKLIVHPGAEKAAVVALDPATGDVLWRSPGLPPAYASFIEAELGGVRQIVGYDSISLGGWDPRTGERLWKLVPPENGDYNVPTPVEVEGKILLSTENNGARIYGFDPRGAIVMAPLARNRDLRPDTSTPVVLGGLVLGCAGKGELLCLDARDGLKKLWALEDGAFEDHVSFIGSGERLLATGARGELLLLRIGRDGAEVLSRMKPFGEDAELYSHPALLGRRLFVRSESSIICIELPSRRIGEALFLRDPADSPDRSSP